MTGRTDRATRLIHAAPEKIYAAFVDPAAYVRWLPPPGMRAAIERFESYPGGIYRMTLTYDAPSAGKGKSSADTDTVEGRFTCLEPGKCIVQTAVFDSDDPAFAGTMTLTWTFTATAEGTEVLIVAEQVPPGISAEDHATGLHATLANLAAFVE